MYDEDVPCIRKAAGKQEFEESPRSHRSAEGIARIQDVADDEADDVADGIGPVHPETYPCERKNHDETDDGIDNANATETHELTSGALDFIIPRFLWLHSFYRNVHEFFCFYAVNKRAFHIG